MLDETRAAHYTIWAVAFVLYVFDAARLLHPHELMLREAGKGRLGVALSDAPFTIAGRVLDFAPLLTPQRGVFIAAWGRAWSDPQGLGSALAVVERLRSSLRFVRVLAVAAFALLFVVGPLLTMALGPAAAVLYTAAALYPAALAASVMLWRQRREFELTALQAAALALEVLVCPAFLPNLVRKITLRHPIAADAAQVVRSAADAEVNRTFVASLESRARELIEEAADDEARQAELERYLATVRDAR